MRRMLEDGKILKAAALASGVCPKTRARWVVRFRVEGIADLQDRSSSPHKLRNPALELPFVGSKPCDASDGTATGSNRSRA